MATKAELEAEVAALRADLDLIGTRLLTEARDRQWCEDYDEVMGEINAVTSEPHMLPCTTAFTVKAEGLVTLRFSDLNVEVTSEGEDGPTAHQIDDAVRGHLDDEVGLNSRMHYVIDGIASVEVSESRVL